MRHGYTCESVTGYLPQTSNIPSQLFGITEDTICYTEPTLFLFIPTLLNLIKHQYYKMIPYHSLKKTLLSKTINSIFTHLLFKFAL